MITYFVLKADGGKTAGCVRLENGRARSSCPCTLLLEDCTAMDLAAEERPLPARPLGAAVLRGDTLAAWGCLPGVKITGAEIARRLRQAALGSVTPDPGRPEPVPMEEPEPVPEPGPENILEAASEPAPEPESPSPAAPDPDPEPEETSEPSDSAALAADFGLLVRHAGEVYESILHPSLSEEKPPQPEKPAEAVKSTSGDWFSETESLLKRIKGR